MGNCFLNYKWRIRSWQNYRKKEERKISLKIKYIYYKSIGCLLVGIKVWFKKIRMSTWDLKLI